MLRQNMMDSISLSRTYPSRENDQRATPYQRKLPFLSHTRSTEIHGRKYSYEIFFQRNSYGQTLTPPQ